MIVTSVELYTSLLNEFFSISEVKKSNNFKILVSVANSSLSNSTNDGVLVILSDRHKLHSQR